MDITIKRIVEEMKAQKLRNIDLANFIGVTPNVVTDWKSGRIKSYVKYIYAIAEFLGVSVEYLKGETDDKGIKKAAPEGAEEGNLFSDVDKRLMSKLPLMSDADKEWLDQLINLKLKERK